MFVCVAPKTATKTMVDSLGSYPLSASWARVVFGQVRGEALTAKRFLAYLKILFLPFFLFPSDSGVLLITVFVSIPDI